MEQLNPPIIMFVITLVATAMFIVPTLYKMPSRLVNFYWTGFWMFLGLIAFTAGTSVALSMAGVQVDPLSTGILAGILAAYVGFVVFGWIRLSGVVILKGIRALRKTA